MAIQVKDTREPNKNIFPSFMAALLVFLAALGAYYLFFSKAPLIDVVIPHKLQTLGEVADLDINPSSVLESPVYQNLREHAGEPSFGAFGRPNPFLPF